MALNVDILSVNELYINGVNILENKRDYVELVGDEKIIIDVPNTTYAKTIPQTGVNLGDLELKCTPLDGKTFDSINTAGGVVVDGVSYDVDSVGAYVQDVNIDSFTIGQSGALKSIDFTTYKWSQVDYGNYSLILNGESSTELSDKGVSNTDSKTLNYFNDNSCMAYYRFNNDCNDDSKLYNLTGSNISYLSGLKSSNCLNVTSNTKLSVLSLPYVSTISFYIDMASIVTKTSNSFTNYSLKIGMPTGLVYISFAKDDSNNFIIYAYTGQNGPKKAVVTNTQSWCHIAIDTNRNIYFNGVSVGNQISGGGSTQYGNILEIYGGDGGDTQFKLENLRLFNRILTSAEILSLYNDMLAPELVGVTTSNIEKANGVSSYEFNGSSYIIAPSNPNYALGLEDFTIEFNTKVTTLATYGATILDNRPDATNGIYWVIGITKDGYIALSANSTSIITGTSNQFNKWCNIALTRKDGVMYLYVNGVLEGQSSTVFNFTRDTFVVGRNAFFATTFLYLKGFIDDLRITKGLCRYTANFTPSSTPDSGLKPVKSKVHTGTIIASDIEYDDYSVNYGTVLDPWVAVEPTITTSGEPFTLIDATITSINTFTTTEPLQIGEVVSADRETFGTIVLSDNGEYMIDSDIFFDGTTEKDFNFTTDTNLINFVQDLRASSYANGLRDAMLSTVNKTIYGHTYNDIIIDAGLGGHFVLGTLYTTGGYNDSDQTTQFRVQISDDGIEYTTVYENLEDLTTNHAHEMIGTGRFVKIVFLDEVAGWGRINTNIVNGKWWNLKIVHPLSTVYKYNASLSVNGRAIVPKFIQWFDNMTINKIVCGKVFINPTTVLKIDSENISKVELDLWQEVKGVY